MTRHTLDFRSWIAPGDYADLVEFAGGVSEYVGWVVSGNPSQTTQSFFDELAVHMVETRLVSEWPGSQRASGKVTQHLFHSNSSTVALVQRYSRSFTDWQEPRLPNDLHFLRPDDTVVLGSISSEADAWLELDDAELAQLVSRWPSLRERVVRGIRDLARDELAFLAWLLDEWESSEPDWTAALRSQLEHLRAVDGYPEVPSVLFVVEGTPDRIDSSDGELPTYVEVADAANDIGLISIWVKGGLLSGLDVSWWGDGNPRDVFNPSRLTMRDRRHQ